MARRNSIAFYTSPKGLSWRRQSEPSTTGRANAKDAFSSCSEATPKAFRRYSFSALEDHRKSKGQDKNIGALANRNDLTPLQIRTQVEGILQRNGFKEMERAKVNQLRRFSLSCDKEAAMPLLGDGVRRHSFGALAEPDATSIKCNRVDSKGLQSKEAGPVVTFDRDAERHESKAPGEPVRTSAWSNSEKATYSHRPHLRRTLPDSKVEIVKLPEAENVDDHLQFKKSLWKGRCLRDSISKFRNRVVDAPRSSVETDTEYWRRCRSLSIDDGSSNLPKCKYRLRENGLIASELANSTRIDIDTSVNKLEEYDCHRPTDQSASEAVAPSKAEVLHNLLKRRRRSSLFSEYDFDRKTLLQRSLTSFSDRNSQVDSPDLSGSQTFSFQRSLSHQDSKPGAEVNGTHQRAPWRRGSTEKRRWSLTPSEGFELIGTAALHGTPGYKGRLMLLTARTVRFHEDFDSET